MTHPTGRGGQGRAPQRAYLVVVEDQRLTYVPFLGDGEHRSAQAEAAFANALKREPAYHLDTSRLQHITPSSSVVAAATEEAANSRHVCSAGSCQTIVHIRMIAVAVLAPLF